MPHSALSSVRMVIGGPIMRQALALAHRAAASDAKVLVTGESGVGKELFVREIHARSARALGPLVTVNCAAVAETLLESELFGHTRGSFTGAYRDQLGKLDAAEGGTLFLDEAGEMSLRMQALLLRFLETGECQRVGSCELLRRVNVRVIAATNRDLTEKVASGGFREDLLYRLRVIHIHVPPLRERRGDIGPLIDFFASHRSRPVRFSVEALEVLERYRWPGNVRELQNVVEQAAWLSGGAEVLPEHLPAAVRAPDSLVPTCERRRLVADDLYDAVTTGGYGFWAHVYPLFLSRDITRRDLRELVRRGLQTARGNYRMLMHLFGMPEEDYQRFHNFLASHGCKVDYHEFRTVMPAAARSRRDIRSEFAHRLRGAGTAPAALLEKA